MSLLGAFSRPGKENDKIEGFQGLPGRVGTLDQLLEQWSLDQLLEVVGQTLLLHTEIGHGIKKPPDTKCISWWE